MKTKQEKAYDENEEIKVRFRELMAFNIESRHELSLIGCASRHSALTDHINHFYRLILGFLMVMNGADSEAYKEAKNEWLLLSNALSLLNNLYQSKSFMTFSSY